MVKAKVVLAKNVFHPAEHEWAIKRALAEQAQRVKRNLERDIADWETAVVFTIAWDGEFAVTISTDNDIYRYQDAGTPKHTIRPNVKQALAFSIPNVGRIITKLVNHPGNKAQGWTIREAKQAQRDLPKRVDTYLRGVL